MEQRLVRAVRRGDATTVADVQSRLGAKQWTSLVGATANEHTSTSVVHTALQAEFALLSQPLSMDAASLEHSLTQRQEMLSTLLRAHPASWRRWCPLVDAVHYRLLQSTRQLLERLPRSALRECLMEADVYGQTVLHATAAAKAPGIARRVLLGGAPSILAAVGRHIGVRLPLGAEEPLTVGVLNNRIGEDDLRALLAAGLDRARLSGAVWLEARDARGLTALHHACRAGRAGAVRALLARGANGSAVEAEWGGTCGHTAAARGHTGVLDAWAEAMGGGAVAGAVAGAEAHHIGGERAGSGDGSEEGGTVGSARELESVRARLLLIKDEYGRTVQSLLQSGKLHMHMAKHAKEAVVVGIPEEAVAEEAAAEEAVAEEAVAEEAVVEEAVAEEACHAHSEAGASTGLSHGASQGTRQEQWPLEELVETDISAIELGGVGDAPSAFTHPPTATVATEGPNLTRRDFVRLYESLGTPVLLRQGCAHWPASSLGMAASVSSASSASAANATSATAAASAAAAAAAAAAGSGASGWAGTQEWTAARLRAVVGHLPAHVSMMPYQQPQGQRQQAQAVGTFLDTMEEGRRRRAQARAQARGEAARAQERGEAARAAEESRMAAAWEESPAFPHAPRWNATEPPAFLFDGGRLLGETVLADDIGPLPCAPPQLEPHECGPDAQSKLDVRRQRTRLSSHLPLAPATTDLPPSLPVSGSSVLQVEAGGVVLRQLSISPPLAGAHPHFHGVLSHDTYPRFPPSN